MKEAIDFTIIIPTYNRADFILNTINSVLVQDYTNFEIIVVDDGSTDNTKELVSSIKDSRLRYIHKINEERAVARNTGIKLSNGKYITFLDSDDNLFPNHLSEAKKFIGKHPAVQCFHQAYQIRNQLTGKINKRISKNLLANKQLIKGNLLSCNGVFVCKDIANNNLFNENRSLTTLEDWELWLRIAIQHKIYNHPVITSEIVDHENRSVLIEDKSQLVNKFTVFMDLINNNKEIQDYYFKDLRKFKASCYTYISLHLALTKKYKIESIKYLWKGIISSPSFIFQRRFLAIIKHLLF
ncbi:MAG: glycosyltransferase family 2 protein [Crocinitomicaceae bacterium]